MAIGNFKAISRKGLEEESGNKPTRFYSKKQEDKVAKSLGGRRNLNSGATMFDKGDVSLDNWLLECKTKTTPSESISIKKEWIQDICEFLLKYLPVLFVPFLVGIISHFDLIGKNLLLLTINIFITTAITLVVTALFVENVIKFVRLKKIKDMKND